MPALFLETIVAAYRPMLPAERCVDDCLVLAHAYAQFGMEGAYEVLGRAVCCVIPGLTALCRPCAVEVGTAPAQGQTLGRGQNPSVDTTGSPGDRR